MLLMSGERARAENRPFLGRLAGWGQSGDAYHATSPDPAGGGLARAVRAALARAGAAPDAVAAVCAHGTGTPLNDAMEAQAFTDVFGAAAPPVFGVKGSLGHTLGAAGVLEASFTLLALREGRIPPTVGNAALPGGPIAGRFALTTNSGFGGINAALVLQGGG
jgi:3-oxoacyl-[acyl-carrier-protein] synthase II